MSQTTPYKGDLMTELEDMAYEVEETEGEVLAKEAQKSLRCGHPDIPVNVYIRDGGYPKCRICSRERTNQRRRVNPAIRQVEYQRNSEVIKARMAAWKMANPERVREHNRLRKERNPEGVRRIGREYHWRKWGLDFDESGYQTLFEAQGGHCLGEILGLLPNQSHEPNEYGRFVPDHDHETLEVRGLLCNSCNLKDVLGIFMSALDMTTELEGVG